MPRAISWLPDADVSFKGSDIEAVCVDEPHAPTGSHLLTRVSSSLSNPFDSEVSARLYVDGRPDYSRLALNAIRKLLRLSRPVGLAVDVGSGTGISTRAIAPLARRVIGVEPSRAMLGKAIPVRNVAYRIGSAEDLPIDDDSCDLISVGSALNWFDRHRFLAECDRVAKADAWLVIHEHGLIGRLDTQSRLLPWPHPLDLTRGPSQRPYPPWQELGGLGAWRHIGVEWYEHRVHYTPARLLSYLLTQGLGRTGTQGAGRGKAALRASMSAQVERFCAGDQGIDLLFSGSVACHRRAHPEAAVHPSPL